MSFRRPRGRARDGALPCGSGGCGSWGVVHGVWFMGVLGVSIMEMSIVRPSAAVAWRGFSAPANAHLFLFLVDLGATEERGTRAIGAARRADGFPVERLFLPLDLTAAVGQMQSLALLGLAHLALVGIVGPGHLL